MSTNSPRDQNKEEFKKYLDKTGLLEFINGNVSQNKKNEFKEFLEFLNKAGVLEFLDSVLKKLYKESNKPSDAREYIKKTIGGVKADKEEIAKLSYENDELKKRIEELEKTEAELKEKLMGAADAPANNALITAANVDAAEVSATALHEPPDINSFSNELVETILSVLPLRDLMSAVRVSKRWNKIGEGPQLWSGIDLVVSNLAHMPGILGLSRLTKLKQLTLKDISKEMLEANDNDEVFESIENHEGLKTLKLFRCNVSEMKKALLARVLTKMEEVRLERTNLNRAQWNAFFNSMSDDTKLKKLEIIGRRLSLTEANPQSLAKAVSKLEMFELDVFPLTSEQSKAMFKQLAIKSKLKSLKISWVDLHSVEETSLVTVLRQLEEAALCHTSLNARQCTAIIGLVAAGNSKLKVLRLAHNDLRHVNPPDMAKAVGNMEIADLNWTQLTNVQCKEIFNFAQGDSNLKVLNIGGNNLLSVEPASLAKTVGKLEIVDLSFTQLNYEQCKEIFKYGDSNLKVLNIAGNDLRSVKPASLAKTVGKLEIVELNWTQLTYEQCKEIFKYVQGDSNLKVLNIAANDLRSVKPASLAKTVGKLEIVNLNRTKLTYDQCKEIFKYVQGDSNLKSVNIGGNDLRSVEPASLAKTVGKIEKCNLMWSELTRPQLEATFKQLNEDCKLKELDVSNVSLSEVEGDVLSKAIANLVEVDLNFTHLTTQQLEAIFMEIKAGRKLKILKLRGTEMRSVKIDSLVGALGCLEEVHLSRDWLTPEQRDAVRSDDCRAKVFM